MKPPKAIERIEKRIIFLRGQKVMLDSDLAELYGVATKRLNEQVRRNMGRFPPDFCFQLDDQEVENLRSQFATSRLWGGSRYLPLAFTEQGIAMLSSVLGSERAICVNVEIMRAFVKLREIVASHKELACRIDELEKRYDSRFKVVFEAIRRIVEPPVKPKPKIGFDLNGSRGSASVELAFAAPLVALFIILSVQFAAFFTRSVRDVAEAGALASRLVGEWDAAHAERGFLRPCLEMMPERSVRFGGRPVPLGVGGFEVNVGVPAEVHIVAGNICGD